MMSLKSSLKKRWLHYFDQEQFLLLDFADLKNCPKQLMNEVTGFLDIEYTYSDFKAKKEESRGILSKKDANKEKNLKKYNSNTYHSKMEEKTREILQEYFAPHDKELKELTGKTFGWMKK